MKGGGHSKTHRGKPDLTNTTGIAGSYRVTFNSHLEIIPAGLFFIEKETNNMRKEQIITTKNNNQMKEKGMKSRFINLKKRFVSALSGALMGVMLMSTTCFAAGDSFDNVKLVDFDIAMEYNSAMEDMCILGTKGYAPPEQYVGKTTPKSDIYALGMVMHQLLTGVNLVEMKYEIKAIRQYNPSLSKGLEKIVEKCIKPNPDERYSSCFELINDLSRLKAKQGKKGILEKLGLR